MDLPDYLDSFRLGYERALERPPGPTRRRSRRRGCRPGVPAPARLPGPAARTVRTAVANPARPIAARSRWHHDHDCGCEHDHHHDHDWHHDHDCGCATITTITITTMPPRSDCGCGHHMTAGASAASSTPTTWSTPDAASARVVPIVIENDTRKVREDVTLDVSDVRTSGGRTLPWKVAVLPRLRSRSRPAAPPDRPRRPNRLRAGPIRTGREGHRRQPEGRPGQEGVRRAKRPAATAIFEERRARQRRRLRQSATSRSASADASCDPSSWRSPSCPPTAMPTTRGARAPVVAEHRSIAPVSCDG